MFCLCLHALFSLVFYIFSFFPNSVLCFRKNYDRPNIVWFFFWCAMLMGIRRYSELLRKISTLTTTTHSCARFCSISDFSRVLSFLTNENNKKKIKPIFMWFNESLNCERIQQNYRTINNHRIPSGRSFITVKARWILKHCKLKKEKSLLLRSSINEFQLTFQTQFTIGGEQKKVENWMLCDSSIFRIFQCLHDDVENSKISSQRWKTSSNDSVQSTRLDRSDHKDHLNCTRTSGRARDSLVKFNSNVKWDENFHDEKLSI